MFWVNTVVFDLTCVIVGDNIMMFEENTLIFWENTLRYWENSAIFEANKLVFGGKYSSICVNKGAFESKNL